jgi:hypothetical protein
MAENIASRLFPKRAFRKPLKNKVTISRSSPIGCNSVKLPVEVAAGLDLSSVRRYQERQTLDIIFRLSKATSMTTELIKS